MPAAGSITRYVPYLLQSVRHGARAARVGERPAGWLAGWRAGAEARSAGFQDLGAFSIPHLRKLRDSCLLRCGREGAIACRARSVRASGRRRFELRTHAAQREGGISHLLHNYEKTLFM
jgi:hypothetical protein